MCLALGVNYEKKPLSPRRESGKGYLLQLSRLRLIINITLMYVNVAKLVGRKWLGLQYAIRPCAKLKQSA